MENNSKFKVYETDLSEFKPDPKNHNKHTLKGHKMVTNSMQKRGYARPGFAANDGTVLGGNLSTIEIAPSLGIGDGKVIVIETSGNIPIIHKRTDVAPDSLEARQLSYEDNFTSFFSFDLDPAVTMADIEAGFDFEAIEICLPDLAEMLDRAAGELLRNGNEGRDVEPQIDKAEELRVKWGTELGQLWQLGEHRLICGDCTDKAVVERVMGGEKATLCHADPPYGMGKENEGIANDNLYREKLDAFQMQWWKSGRQQLEDNASAYIWGKADDLWRLWYCGGLRDSERLTFRNEIVWAKEGGQGIGSEGFRCYPPVSERCLFFMLGEQGFNNNADNYWDGWEDIRKYLKLERDKMGWDNAKCKTLAGHSPTSGCHWFDFSQWSFVTEDVYISWQQAANGAAFKRDYDALKRDYDALKRDFYATRAYFDNTHTNMTDVWNVARVAGDERHEHATPKPVAMIERIIESSTPKEAIVFSPFVGSGTDLIACENLNRRCRAIEIDPGYCAVTLERWSTLTGQQPQLINESNTIKNG